MIKLCQNNLDFKVEFKDYLTKYETQMQLFFRNLINDNETLNQNQIRGGVYLDNKLCLIFLNAYPFNILLFEVTKDQNLIAESIRELLSYIKTQNISFRGCQCNKRLSEVFFKEVKAKFNLDMEVVHSMDIMKLTNVLFTKTTGTIKLATMENLEFIKKVYLQFSKEALNEHLSDEEINNTAINKINSQGVYLYYNQENEVTSCVNVSKVLPNGYTLNLVYTDLSMRNKGYAKNMISLICQELLKSANYVTLFVDKQNPISNRVYLDIGFNYLTENYDCRLITK